ncbi:MAG: ATP-dependent 6-phosphofructokinase [Acidimicrobiales bacterium]|jgi:6-phosphofructokinase 1
MRVGVLTGGGDCPGLNAVIRAVVRKGEVAYQDEFVGFADGWRGVIEGRSVPLDSHMCRGILPRGGTILGTSRVSPHRQDGGVAAALEHLADVDALVVIGGEGTLSAGLELFVEEGVPLVGVPKTIDNDIGSTDVSFGFHTAVQIATDAIDRLHTTAEAHDRVMVCEVMGRHAGWIAIYAGIAGGAAEIIIPEEPFDIDEICASLVKRHSSGRWASVVVVAEGAIPKPGTIDVPEHEIDIYGHRRLGGISNLLAKEIEDRTGFESRVTILGHVQRGGTPTAFDRVLATRYGMAAIDAVHEGAFGQMVALQGDRIVLVPLAGSVRSDKPKAVPHDLFEVGEIFCR